MIVPEVGFCNPTMVFINDDFPAPLGPNKPNIPFSIFKRNIFNSLKTIFVGEA
jgi:hypothetical protein